MTYDFAAQLAKGEQAEAQLDRFFADRFDITKATREEQRQGIDRHFRNKADGRTFRIEYKADERASATGNAFVETMSVDSAGKQGWAYTSQADLLLYYLPKDLLVYVIRLKDLRQQLAGWRATYPQRKADNGSYATWGVLVPLDEFEDIAKAVISL